MPCGESGMAGISIFAQLAGTSKSLSSGTVRSILVSSLITPDGSRIISGSDDNTLKLWDADSGNCILTLSGHSESVWAAAFSPDGKRIISGSFDSTIKIWDAQTGQCLLTMANLPDNETASWSETELKLLSASPNAWRWIGLADGCRRLPIELLDDPATG
jgi:WD40 repeat protein